MDGFNSKHLYISEDRHSVILYDKAIVNVTSELLIKDFTKAKEKLLLFILHIDDSWTVIDPTNCDGINISISKNDFYKCYNEDGSIYYNYFGDHLSLLNVDILISRHHH